MIAVIGNGIQNVFFAIGILGWPQIARVFRSAILSVKEKMCIRDSIKAFYEKDPRGDEFVDPFACHNEGILSLIHI